MLLALFQAYVMVGLTFLRCISQRLLVLWHCSCTVEDWMLGGEWMLTLFWHVWHCRQCVCVCVCQSLVLQRNMEARCYEHWEMENLCCSVKGTWSFFCKYSEYILILLCRCMFIASKQWYWHNRTFTPNCCECSTHSETKTLSKNLCFFPLSNSLLMTWPWKYLWPVSQYLKPNFIWNRFSNTTLLVCFSTSNLTMKVTDAIPFTQLEMILQFATCVKQYQHIVHTRH